MHAMSLRTAVVLALALAASCDAASLRRKSLMTASMRADPLPAVTAMAQEYNCTVYKDHLDLTLSEIKEKSEAAIVAHEKKCKQERADIEKDCSDGISEAKSAMNASVTAAEARRDANVSLSENAYKAWSKKSSDNVAAKTKAHDDAKADTDKKRDAFVVADEKEGIAKEFKRGEHERADKRYSSNTKAATSEKEAAVAEARAAADAKLAAAKVERDGPIKICQQIHDDKVADINDDPFYEVKPAVESLNECRRSKGEPDLDPAEPLAADSAQAATAFVELASTSRCGHKVATQVLAVQAAHARLHQTHVAPAGPALVSMADIEAKLQAKRDAAAEKLGQCSGVHEAKYKERADAAEDVFGGIKTKQEEIELKILKNETAVRDETKQAADQALVEASAQVKAATDAYNKARAAQDKAAGELKTAQENNVQGLEEQVRLPRLVFFAASLGIVLGQCFCFCSRSRSLLVFRFVLFCRIGCLANFLWGREAHFPSN